MASEPVAPAPLPYGPLLTRLLRPLQRAFLVLNRGLMAPLMRLGLGWLVGNPLTGHLMLLRTRGRRSGALREAPIGYVVRDGCVYCVAGYGKRTPWYLNLLDDPRVEVLMPTRRFHGHAVPVSDETEWLGAYRALIRSFGLIGRAVAGDVRRSTDETLLTRHRSLPVIRITPDLGEGGGPIVAGPFDPGGAGWILPHAGALALTLALLRRARSNARG